MLERKTPYMIVEKRTGKSTLLTIDGKTKTITEWAKEKGIDNAVINRRIRNGWPEDRLFENVKYSPRRSFNEHYFDVIDNECKAYWIGFIWCDGYMAIRDRNGRISYEFKLSLKDADHEHLRKFNECINGNYDINFYASHSLFGDMIEARLLITNQYFGKTLVDKYGIVPYRQDCSKLLNQIPDNLMKHFIRGILDADGCFSKYNIVEHGYDVVKYNVSIGTNEDILKIIEKHLIEHKIVTPYERKLYKRHNEDDKDGEYRSLNFSGKAQCLNILNYIYNNASIYLDRKYQKYLKIVGDINCNIN